MTSFQDTPQIGLSTAKQLQFMHFQSPALPLARPEGIFLTDEASRSLAIPLARLFFLILVSP
jgi:hypothetical protein